MKKFLLSLGIISCCSASAQQKELFDLNKYLLDKNSSLKKQLEKKTTFPKLFPIQKSLNLSDPAFLQLSDGSKVNKLGMPIVTVNMEKFRTMPNPGREYFYYHYRNPAMRGPEHPLIIDIWRID